MMADYHGSSAIIDVFKMDIEYTELEFLPQMLQSGFLADKVKQLAVEIHFNAGDPLENFKQRVRILQDLEKMDPSLGSDIDLKRVAGRVIRFSSRHIILGSNDW